MIFKKLAFVGLLLMAKMTYAEGKSVAPPPASFRFDKVEMPVKEQIDGVSNGVPLILSVMVASTSGKTRWDIVLVSFETDESHQSVWTTVDRIGSSSDQAIFSTQRLAHLRQWLPGRLIEFENVDSGPYRCHLTLKRVKDAMGKLVWLLDCSGTYKRVDSAPVQKFEMVKTKNVEIKYTTLKTVGSGQ